MVDDKTMQFVLIDEPSPFDTLEVWQRHLEEMKGLPDDVFLKAEIIKAAEEMIARTRSEMSSSNAHVSERPAKLKHRPRLTPQERIILAKKLNKKSKNPNLTPQQRQEALRHARNLIQINLAMAKREDFGLANMRLRPPTSFWMTFGLAIALASCEQAPPPRGRP